MIEIVRSDLLEVEAEAYLRPIRSDLSAITPLGRRIEVEAGEALVGPLEALGEMPLGSAVITPGGGLRAHFVIHVTVESSDEGVTERGVAAALENGLRRASEWGIASLALPALGVGAGTLDAERAAARMIPLLLDWTAGPGTPKAILAVRAGYEADAFERALASARSLDGSGTSNPEVGSDVPEPVELPEDVGAEAPTPEIPE